MKKISAIIILLSFGFLSGCYKEPVFDLKPNIEFQQIRKQIILDKKVAAKKDSIIVTIKFQDGDGDLGYSESEKAVIVKKILDIEKQIIENKIPPRENYDEFFNYVIKMFRKSKGKFTEIKNSVTGFGLFLRLKNDGKIGPIEGKLDYSFDIFNSTVPKKDSLKFQIYIKDRAGNISNTVESDIIVLNEF